MGSILTSQRECHSSQYLRNPSRPRNTASPPSIRIVTSEDHSISGWLWLESIQASKSPRFQPSRDALTISTFSCDIARQYPVGQVH